jgi:cell shape-determining protein MreD
MKLVANLKINIFLIVVILAKYIPFQVNIKYQYTPEILSLLIYIIYLLRKDMLGHISIFLLSLLDDLLKLHYLGATIIQNFIYVVYIDTLKKKYSNNMLFDWLSFTILNIIVLPCKYVIMNFFKNDDMLPPDIILKKTFVTIAFFPLIYYLTNKFVLAKK